MPGLADHIDPSIAFTYVDRWKRAATAITETIGWLDNAERFQETQG